MIARTYEHTENARKGITCQARARQLLIQNHKAEYDLIHGNLREAAGLSRNAGAKKHKLTVDQKIAKLEQKIAELRAQE